MNKVFSNRLPIWLALAIPLAACQTTASQINASGSMGSDDDAFVNTAYGIAQLDERAGKLATTNSTDPRIQDVAGTMSSEAKFLYPNLQGALQAENKPIPTIAPAAVTAQVDKLNTLKGAAFDREFIAIELAAHQHAVDILKKEDTTTKDGALKIQVETELPAVQSNLDRLKFLSGDLAPKQG